MNSNSIFKEFQNYLHLHNDLHILICTPCYGNQCFTEYTKSLCETVSIFTQLNVKFEMYLLGQESLITRARNGCIDKFLSNDYSHLLFIDADIGFNPLDILEMLLCKQDIIGGIYPKKAVNWGKVIFEVKNNNDISIDDLKMKSIDLNYNETEDNNNHPKCFRVKDLATGFMLISKNLIQNMIYKYGEERKYINNISGLGGGNHFYNFFDIGICNETKVYLSEDFYFSKLVRDMGIPIYALRNCELSHTGNITYRGNINNGENWTLNTDLNIYK